MPFNKRPDLLQIKKYPNRRFYDATQSRHITLQELYEMVRGGRDVRVTDSRTNEDITNLVLLQMMLEKEQPKLDVFPSSMIHMLIRVNRQALRASLDHFFGPFLNMFTTSQTQFDAFWRHVMGGQLATPVEWAKSMAPPFMPGGEPLADDAAATDNDDAPDDPKPEEDSLDELRRQA